MNNLQSLTKDGEIEAFAQAVKDYQEGRLEAEKFTAIRLQHGVYGQRQDDMHMFRIKIPGGRLNVERLEAIADILERNPNDDLACITTRQDMQLHFVPLDLAVPFMQRLAQAGIVTREACGNTIRNVTGCPLAGVCPREHADIRPFLDGTVKHLLRHPLTQHMPRKFKISFSGCESDCAQGMMHDVGVVAVQRNGEFGFKVLAAGGLGHKPYKALLVEEFLPEKDLRACIEAVITLHHRYSDRTKRAKSRVKFLVDKFGAEGFLEKYREEFARTRAAFADAEYVRGEWKQGQDVAPPGIGAPRQVYAQKQAGLNVFPISVPLGDLTAPQLRALIRLMRDEGLDDIRTTQDQNLNLLGVRADQIERVRAAVLAMGLSEPQPGDDVVSCPGTWTCKLGITASRVAAPKLLGSGIDVSVRVSSCHNGCAQPYVGDIGLHGEGKRVLGKLVPHYQLHLGGDGMAGGDLGIKGPHVPSARIERAVDRIRHAYVEQKVNGQTFYDWSRARGETYFHDLLKDLSTVTESELPNVLKDHGGTEAFRVLTFGGGECAGIGGEFLASTLADAQHERDFRNTFVARKMYPEALECAGAILNDMGKSMLYASDLKECADASETAGKLRTAGRMPLALIEEYSELHKDLAALNDETDVDPQRLAAFVKTQDVWADKVRQACEAPKPKQDDLGVSLNLDINLPGL